jgi:hypothetical protein
MPYYVYEKKKIIFVTIRKCGTISFKKLLDSKPELDIKLLKVKEMIELNNTKQYKIVAIVRNPYTRAISSWQRARFLRPDEFKNDITKPNVDSFKNFLNELSYVKDRHWQKQTNYLRRFDEYEIIKLENINEDLKYHIDECNIFFPHKHSHKEESHKLQIDNHKDFYDEEAKKLVETLYNEDIIKYKYEF